MKAAIVLALLAIGLAASAGAYALMSREPGDPGCERGASSIGPVSVEDGEIVGETTPRTSGCVPGP